MRLKNLLPLLPLRLLGFLGSETELSTNVRVQSASSAADSVLIPETLLVHLQLQYPGFFCLHFAFELLVIGRNILQPAQKIEHLLRSHSLLGDGHLLRRHLLLHSRDLFIPLRQFSRQLVFLVKQLAFNVLPVSKLLLFLGQLLLSEGDACLQVLSLGHLL